MKRVKITSLIMNMLLVYLVLSMNLLGSVIKEFDKVIPMSVNVNITNDESEPEFLNYVYIKATEGSVKERASHYSRTLVKFPFYTKLKALELIHSENDNWYKVELIDIRGSKRAGYISAQIVEFREFRFEEMTSRINKLQNFLREEKAAGKQLVSINTYVPNPSNENMGRDKDKYGVSSDQNSKGTHNGEILYIPDRSILSVDKVSGNSAYVNALSIPEKGIKINKKEMTSYPNINPNFRKVIAIDLVNENQGVFQKNENGEWELISYTLNKTGMESQLGFETPKGYFVVPMVKYLMGYRDEKNNDAGTAKHAIRFSGGGYIHGTPIEYSEEHNRDYFIKQKEHTLGTTEGTRKCVRNTEDHIKFLFDWVTNGKVDKRYNEQHPDENVMVIVF